MLFDRTRLRHRPHFAAADFLHVHAARELVERLRLVSRSFASALVCGPLSERLRAVWRETGVPLTFLAPAPGMRPDVAADVAMPFARRFPLAISLNELHLADDPVRVLGELRGTLRPDGLFLGAVACTGTLGELADALIFAEARLTGGAAMRVAPFGDVRRWGDGLAKAGFALPVADEMRLTVRYDGLADLFRDLGAMGLRGVLAERRPAPKRLFAEAEAHYRANNADPDGRLRATFALGFLSGWAPGPGQQKPARRGSATMRLEDALKPKL